MKIAIVALTKNGSFLARKIGLQLKADIYLKQEFIDNKKDSTLNLLSINNPFNAFVGELFLAYDALVMIMATGIVVRSIAKYINSKTSDPAVVVIDELGNFAISLLSGHIGGANDLACEIAKITGGQPVITTATDINGVISFDVFAKENNIFIENIENLKYISGALLKHEDVAFYSDSKIKGDIPRNIINVKSEEVSAIKNLVVLSNRTDVEVGNYDKVLYLRPKNLLLGIGCRRDTKAINIQEAVEDFLLKNGKSINSIRCVATIDLKADELGLLEFCRNRSLELKIINRDEIKKIEDSFTNSSFVKEITGVSSVAEPCSILVSNKGSLIVKKTIYKGITLALTEEECEFSI